MFCTQHLCSMTVRASICYSFTSSVCWRQLPYSTSSTKTAKQKDLFDRGNVNQRSAFPFRLADIMRKDILLNDNYTGQLVFARKNWLQLKPENAEMLKLLERSTATRSKLGCELAALDDNALIEIVTYFSQKKKIEVELLKAAEDECCKRCCTWDPSSMLLIADAFYVAKYEPKAYLSQLMVQFFNQWEKLSLRKEHILQLLFYLSRSRRVSVLLMHKIEDYLAKNVDSFTANELGLICHAYFATNTTFRNYTIVEKISERTLHDLGKNQLRPYLLGNILKCFRHCQFKKIQFYDEVGHHLCRTSHLVKEMTFQELANLVSTYSSVKITNSYLFAVIADCVKAQLKTFSESKQIPRLKDLSRLVWSFAQLQEPIDCFVHKFLVESYESRSSVAHAHMEGFVEALVALTLVDVYSSTLFDILFSKEFLQKKSGRSLEQEFQMLLLESANSIKHSRQESWNDFEFQCSTGKRLGNLDKEMQCRQGLLSLMVALHDKLKDPSLVCCHFILPHSFIPDIELRLDENRRPLTFNKSMADVASLQNVDRSQTRVYCNESSSPTRSITSQHFEEMGIVSSMKPENIHTRSGNSGRIVIKVMGWNQYVVNKPTLLGIHQIELKLLSRLGYEVYVINPTEAQQLDHMSSAERVGYVNQLFSTLNICFN